MSNLESSPDLAAEIDENIGSNLRAQREKLGLSQAEVARLMTEAGLSGFHQTTIARIEKGERALRVAEVLTLGRILETSLEYLAESSDSATMRTLKRSLDDQSKSVIEAISGLVDSRIWVARSLDIRVPHSDEQMEVIEVVGQQLKANIDRDLLDRLEEALYETDPAMRLGWVYSGKLRTLGELAKRENAPDIGAREAALYDDMREYLANDGEHPEAP